MILHSLALENWALFRDRKEFEFTEGLNLLAGPNESGKSTTIKGLRRGFFDKHTTAGETLRRCRPWGSTKLPPKVEIIFATGEGTFRVRKIFLYQKSAQLDKKIDGEWSKVEEGDAADKETIKKLEGSIKQRGASGPKNWGIAQALWGRQGEKLPEEEFNQDLKERVQAILGTVIPSAKSKDIFQLVKDSFDQSWQPKQRNPCAGSELKELNKKIENREKEVDNLEEERKETEDLREQITDLESRIEELEEREDRAKKRLEEAKKAAELAERHKEEREDQAEKVEGLRDEVSELEEKISKIESLEKKVEENQEEVTKLEKRADSFEENEEEIEIEIGKLEDKHEEIKEEIGESKERIDNLKLGKKALTYSLNLESIKDSLKEAKTLKEKMEKVESKLEGISSPSKAELERIRQLHSKIGETKTKLESIGLTTEITAYRHLTGELQEENQFEIEEGEKKEWNAPQEMVVDLDDIASLTIKSGSEDVKELDESLEELKEELRGKREKFGSDDPKELRERRRKKRQFQRDLEGKEERIIDLLTPLLPSYEASKGVCPFCENEHREGEPYQRKGSYQNHLEECSELGDPISKIKRLRDFMEGKVAEAWGKLPENSQVKEFRQNESPNQAKKEIESRLEDLDNQVEERREEMDEIQGKLGKKRKRKEAIREKREKGGQKMERLKGKLGEQQNRLKEIKSDEINMEERQARLEGLKNQLKKEEEKLKELKEEKVDKEKKPLDERKNAETEKEELESSISEKQQELKKKRGRLGEKTEQGWFSKLTETKEDLGRLRNQRKKEKTRAKAVELLFDLINYNRKRSIRGVLEPLEKRVNEDLQQLFGRAKYNLQLDQNLKPAKVKPENWQDEASTDSLSYGTQEQIAFVLRLALGKILSEEEKQLVVLDDPLTNTDVPRLRNAQKLIEQYSRDLQVILLTCDRTKYTSISNKNVISLG